MPIAFMACDLDGDIRCEVACPLIGSLIGSTRLAYGSEIPPPPPPPLEALRPSDPLDPLLVGLSAARVEL